MAEVSQSIKYVKLDDGVSFALVRTNPKLTTNTKLMYNGKRMYMESYASSELLNRTMYKNVSVKQNSTYNKDIASFLVGSGSQAYSVYQNFSDITISDSFDNQFETMYWCGAEYIDSSFYDEEIGFVAPLYLREKLPNYFMIFRLNTPSNYNFVVGEDGKPKDPTFDFKTDILDKAVLIKTFDLREGSVLGNYIHNYVEQEAFEFDKSMYVNFSNGEVTYYGINKNSGILEKRVENFENELLRNDNPVLYNDKWFTEGFERNGLIFPYIMNIEYLFDDNNFKHNNEESYDFARYIGVYCNNIEFGEFSNLDELGNAGYTEDNAIYYFKDNNEILHRYSNRYSNNDSGFKIDGKDYSNFDISLISGFEKDRVTGYAEPLNIYEGFINRAQYGFEILKPLEPGDWVGIEYDGYVECYFADDKNVDNNNGEKHKYDMLIGEYSDFRFSVSENSTLNDIAEALVKSVNSNKKSKFEARCSDNVVVFYAKREEKDYNNGSENGGAKMLMEASLIYNRKISLPIYNDISLISGNDSPIEDISYSDVVNPVTGEKSSFGDYYKDYFCGACDVDIDSKTDMYKNVFKIYADEYIFFNVGRYLKTNNGNGRKIIANMMYINLEGNIDPEYRLVIVEDAPEGKQGNVGYDVSVSSTNQVEIMDIFKPNYGILSWFPIKDFDFDINYSSYGDYRAFADECNILSKKIIYETDENAIKTEIKTLAKSTFFDDFGNNLESEYDYYLEQFHPDLCLLSKTTPYISKWGYYDEQKDSCENPYRLNVNKVFGVSNLSANIYLRKCDDGEYTHSMPYYMILNKIDYLKNYQYIESDEIYKKYYNKSDTECVEYWINEFMNTTVDRFSEFFSGKKYGNRFDRKYSRFLGGNKFHNASTLFRGVKFEIVQQYNDIEKRTNEYNNYKFSFVYIPVMVNSMFFDNKVYFVKNDTFKFIVGIVFVNTMIGLFNHNIFNGDIDYFNKGYIYAACKNIIKPIGLNTYILTILSENSENNKPKIYTTTNIFWNKKINKKFYLWKSSNNDNETIITEEKSNIQKEHIVGEFKGDEIENIIDLKKTVTSVETESGKKIKITWNKYYSEYDATIYKYDEYTYFGELKCEVDEDITVLINIPLVDICDIEWDYYDNLGNGYKVDISNLHIKSESIQNILINLGVDDSISKIEFYNVGGKFINNSERIVYENINVDYENSDIKFNTNNTLLESSEVNIEKLRVDIHIKDIVENGESLMLKNYFSVFDQISMCSITESINNNYNVKYYSTVNDNNYNIRVIEPDIIEIEDQYEVVPVKVLQKNKNIIGSIDIKRKMNIDKIGKKVINRYSGFYNPIFNDILYYNDYTYTKTVGRIKNAIKYELPYSNTYIDYNYNDPYGEFGVIKNMYYHKTNINRRSDRILTSKNPIYPAINEYALDFRDYNIFSSNWDDGYYVSQDDLETRSICSGIGSMKETLCMFGSKYLNIPDYIFIDTFENGKQWDERMYIDNRDISNTEIMFKEINNKTVRYQLFIEKRLKRYLVELLTGVFSKYINKNYSFGDKSTIKDDVEEYVEKNLLKLYKVDKVYMYTKSDRVGINNRIIENDYLKHVGESNEQKIKQGFPVKTVTGVVKLKENNFTMSKVNEFDRIITYNLKTGFKESFGFCVTFKRK